jgi:hypothetical protein
MIIPGFIITWITFPGVMVHEFGHQLFCHLTGTQVHAVCYFRFGNPAGYVIHGRPSSVWKNILICFGPLVVNSAMGFTIGFMTRHFYHDKHMDILGGFLIWLAISIAMHSFPSRGDARSLWHALWRQQSPISTRMVGTPLVAVIYLGAVGSVFWLDLIYGTCIGWVVPSALIG